MKTRKQKIRQERSEEMQETRQLKVEKREERKQLEVKKEKLKKVKPKKEKLKKEKVRKPKKERIKKERPAKQTERKPQPKKTGNSRKAAKDKGMGLRGIQVKLIGAFMIPVILFVIIGFMIYSKCSTTLNSTYEASANTSVGTLEEYLGLGFENIELMATRLSINSAITSYYTGSEVKSESMLMDTKVALSNESTADKFIDHIIVCAKSGTACSEKGAIRGDVYNAFVESEEGKNVESEIGMGSMWISSHPAIDEVTGYDSDEYALSLVTVLKNNSNKSVGYIIIDVKTSFIQDILDNAQISDNSIKGFVLEDGSQVLSGDSDIKFTDTDFYQEALAGENLQGSKEVSYEGADYLFTYSRIEGTNMLVCAMVPQKEIMAGAQAILRYTLIAVAICAVIAIVVGSVLASGISKAIRKVNRVLKKTSDGDLTGQISMKRKDEFNVLSSSITNMIGSMKDLILKMTNVSGHVSDSAVQVSTFAFDNKIKQKLVEKKKVSFTNKKLLQFKTCFTMKKNTSSYILPQSMQSIDQGGDNTLYISSGREGESPLCIAECSAKKGEFRKKYMLHFGDDFPIQKKKEIEGMHSKGSQLQFVIADIKAVKGKNSDGKKVKIKRQYICVIDK